MNQGTEDYAAARCCLINGLFSGLPIAAQAVEKFLKANIYFLDPTYSKKRKHDLIALAKDLKDLEPSFPFEKYHILLLKLINYYEARYPENKNSATTSTALIYELDPLMIYIAETVPVPKEAKNFIEFYFWTNYSKRKKHPLNILKKEHIWGLEKWLTENNHALFLNSH